MMIRKKKRVSKSISSRVHLTAQLLLKRSQKSVGMSGEELFLIRFPFWRCYSISESPSEGRGAVHLIPKKVCIFYTTTVSVEAPLSVSLYTSGKKVYHYRNWCVCIGRQRQRERRDVELGKIKTDQCHRLWQITMNFLRSFLLIFSIYLNGQGVLAGPSGPRGADYSVT